ncbi:ZIP family metal transporter [Thermosphaera sp.]
MFLEADVLGRSLIFGLIPALGTSVGGLIGVLTPHSRESYMDFGLSFAAGLMLVASFTSLLIPSIELSNIYTALAGLVAGVVMILIIDKLTPHEHLEDRFEGPAKYRGRVKTLYLMVFALLIHNIPEGMAVGAGSALEFEKGLALSVAIAIQDVPEGFAVAYPLMGLTRSRFKALSLAVLSGFSETLASVLTGLVIEISQGLIPFILALAAGAMIYVVSDEVIPETHKYGHEDVATLGFVTGFVTMLFLDSLA